VVFDIFEAEVFCDA